MVNAEPISTFLFADLAGFTALTEAHGDERAAELAIDFCRLVRGLSGPGMEEVKTLGDAVMLRCEQAEAAVDLGVRIVEEVSRAGDLPVVRVGMHTGPALARDRDWFGATVNIAARVSSAAAGGQALLTDATRQAAGPIDGVELRRHGQQTFRNVRVPVVLFEAVRRGADPTPLAVDPVCRMAVATGQEAGTLSFGGREYRFCSLECAAAFAAAPESYVEPTRPS